MRGEDRFHREKREVFQVNLQLYLGDSAAIDCALLRGLTRREFKEEDGVRIRKSERVREELH